MTTNHIDVQTVGIVGAGLMGTGIAEVAAARGIETVLVKATEGSTGAVRDRIARSLRRQAEREAIPPEAVDLALARLTVTGDRDALGRCPIVIESIVEDLRQKRALFADLSRRLPEQTIFASNTSTLRLRDMAAPGYHDRMVGMHFFSPVPAMNLVELAHLQETRPELLAACKHLIAQMGKTVVPVVDSAGFVVNRLLVPYLLGAVSAYAGGLASVEEIDTAMKLGCNHPIGPLALCDLIGIDVLLAMAKLLLREFGNERFVPPPILRRMVHDGHLGRKTGLGFYDYAQRPPGPNRLLLPLVRPESADEGIESVGADQVVSAA